MASLDHLCWPELQHRAPLLIVPLGSTEQHGPHLPLGTDTVVACELASRLGAGLAEVADAVVTAPLPFGSAGEHEGFPGTLSVGQEALELVVVELVRSAGWAGGTVLVSGHGGNAEPLRRAVDRLRAEGRAVLAWLPAVPGGDAHAGQTETSLMLALAPGRVRLDDAVPGDRRPLAALLPELRAGGVAAVSPSGVLGDPAGASAEEGERLLAALTDQLLDAVLAWRREMVRQPVAGRGPGSDAGPVADADASG